LDWWKNERFLWLLEREWSCMWWLSERRDCLPFYNLLGQSLLLFIHSLISKDQIHQASTLQLS
jgi:hypothetical protein